MDFKKIVTIISIVAAVTITTGGYLTNGFGILSTIDGRYAKAGELKRLDLRVVYVNAKVTLNHLSQLRNDARLEYFNLKKLKKKHPKDDEVQKLLEQAIEQRATINAEYVKVKQSVENLKQQLVK